MVMVAAVPVAVVVALAVVRSGAEVVTVFVAM